MPSDNILISVTTVFYGDSPIVPIELLFYQPAIEPAPNLSTYVSEFRPAFSIISTVVYFGVIGPKPV